MGGDRSSSGSWFGRRDTVSKAIHRLSRTVPPLCLRSVFCLNRTGCSYSATCSSVSKKGTSMVTQSVANVIQVQRMVQMGVQHGNDMTVGAKELCLDFVLVCKVFDDSIGNPPCNLHKNCYNMSL